jgi:GntR family transcriptional regulator
MQAYRRVAEAIAEGIKDGTWPPGSQLPPIPDLCERFGVSRITVRTGLEELSRRGLVYTGWVDGRRGTYVRSVGRIENYVTDALRSLDNPPAMDAFEANADRIGRRPGKRFEMRMERAPREISERLGVDPDALVVVRMLWQLLDDEPWSRETGYYPRDLAEAVGLDTPEDLPRGTIRVLADAGYEETSWRDEVTFQTASPQDAHDLGVAIGAPLLVHTRTSATAERVTRVNRYVRIAERNSLIWDIGDRSGLDVITKTRGGA